MRNIKEREEMLQGKQIIMIKSLEGDSWILTEKALV